MGPYIGSHVRAKAGVVQMCSLAPDCGIERNEVTRLANIALSDRDREAEEVVSGQTK